MSADAEEQEDELLALQSIFTSEEFVRDESKAAGEIRVSAELPAGFTVAIKEGERRRQYEISVLPPLIVTFELPENYPSSAPPSFTLTCSWLTETQLFSLATQLTDIHQTSGGSVVLFNWVQFLQEDALRFLGIHSLLELPSDEQDTQDLSARSENSHCTPKTFNQSNPTTEVLDAEQPPQTSQLKVENKNDQSSAIGESESNHLDREGFLNKEGVPTSSPLPSNSSGPTDESEQGAASLSVRPKDVHRKQSHIRDLSLTPSQKLMSQILIYDAAQQQRRFATTVFECGVCFLSSLGSDCVQLLDCGHIFCRACISQFCSVQITEGNVQGVSCPEADCAASPTPAQVKDLVGEELFNRYDRLLLQKTLDCMPDVVYCPRLTCGAAVIQEKSGKAAMCSVCGFAFCVTCRKTYHGTESCQFEKSIPENIAEPGCADLPTSQAGIMALWNDYTRGSKQRKTLLENRYGRKALRGTVESILTDCWKAVNTKNCPHCFCTIQKDGGCNHMICTQCRRSFCWASLEILY